MKRRTQYRGRGLSSKNRATLADVASRAGVSPVTVSRAIRHPEMVSEDLRKRIDDAVLSLNYIPNHLASALASTRTQIVGVIVPSLTNGVFDDYLGAIQDVLNPAGIQVLVLNVRYSEIEEEKAIQTLLGYHPEAMIVAGVDQTERSRQMLRNSGVPVVQTMDVTADPIDLNIGLDHTAAGYAAVHYLYDQGHRRIAHLTARQDPRARRRHAGYQRAIDDLGLSTKALPGRSSRRGPRPSRWAERCSPRCSAAGAGCRCGIHLQRRLGTWHTVRMSAPRHPRPRGYRHHGLQRSRLLRRFGADADLGLDRAAPDGHLGGRSHPRHHPRASGKRPRQIVRRRRLRRSTPAAAPRSQCRRPPSGRSRRAKSASRLRPTPRPSPPPGSCGLPAGGGRC